MARPLAALLLVACLAAGCADPGPASSTVVPVGSDTLRIEGLVTDVALRPIPEATLTLRDLGRNATSNADGTFAFVGLEPGFHIVDATALGYEPQTLTVVPTNASVAHIEFALTPLPPPLPYNTTFEFTGRFDCAIEALIIPGSCDLLLEFANDGVNATAGRPAPEPFEDAGRVDFATEPAWTTIVVDVVFDPAAQPGFEALRMTFQGQGNTSQLGTYEQYGRFGGPDDFSARIEPGKTYPDGDAGAVPANATLFRLEFYPQGVGYHDACLPPGAPFECFLGAGAGVNVEFEAIVTTFYVEPAPAGFTRLG